MESLRNPHCCRSMTEHLRREPADEVLVFYSDEHHVYGLPDRKDPTAYMPISYCPWCGTRLSSDYGPDVPYQNAAQPLPPPLPNPVRPRPASKTEPARWRLSP